jgi:hypothetical protein
VNWTISHFIRYDSGVVLFLSWSIQDKSGFVWGQVWWLCLVIPAMWEAKTGKSWSEPDPGQKSPWSPIRKITKAKGLGAWHKALGSNPSTAKRKKKEWSCLILKTPSLLRAGCAAQWYSTYPPCARPWVQPPVQEGMGWTTTCCCEWQINFWQLPLYAK